MGTKQAACPQAHLSRMVERLYNPVLCVMSNHKEETCFSDSLSEMAHKNMPQTEWIKIWLNCCWREYKAVQNALAEGPS